MKVNLNEIELPPFSPKVGTTRQRWIKGFIKFIIINELIFKKTTSLSLTLKKWEAKSRFASTSIYYRLIILNSMYDYADKFNIIVIRLYYIVCGLVIMTILKILNTGYSVDFIMTVFYSKLYSLIIPANCYNGGWIEK